MRVLGGGVGDRDQHLVGRRVEHVERRRTLRAPHRRSTGRWERMTTALSVSIPPSFTPSDSAAALGSKNDRTSSRHHRHPRLERAGPPPRSDRREAPARVLRRGSRPRPRADADRRRPLHRLQQAPRHPGDADTADRPGQGGRSGGQRRDAMFSGEHINTSEDRAVLHTALRLPAGRELERRRPGRRRRRARGARRDGRLHRPAAQRRVDRRDRRAHHDRRQHRHRRLRPRAR